MWWDPPFSPAGLLRAASSRRTVHELAERPIKWRRASREEWPRVWLPSDHRWAKKTNTGLIAYVDDQRLFLVHREWSEPLWGLASYTPAKHRWRHLGFFEPLPALWTTPEGFSDPGYAESLSILRSMRKPRGGRGVAIRAGTGDV